MAKRGLGIRDSAACILTGQPHTAMMGTIWTGNDVKVTFRWAVQTAQN